MAAVYTAVTTFLTNLLSYVTTIISTITSDTALTIFVIGIPLVSFAIGILARLVRNVF